jgi:tetratricopeptide (TPR) repeat protein
MRIQSIVVAAAIFAAAFRLEAATPLEMTQANVQFNLALNLYNTNKLDDAVDSLKKALGVVPEHPQANLLLGLIYSQKANFKEAVPYLRTAAKVSPNNFDAFNNLGIAAYQLKDNDLAESSFKRASEIKPERPDVLINLGVLELAQKKWKAAEDAFAGAAKADPKSVKAWTGVGEAAEKAGDKAEELEALHKSLELEPSDTAVRLNLAQKLYRGDQNDEAIQVLDPLKDKGDSEAEFLLGCVLYRKGRFDDSRERFEAALRARPDYPEARFNLAITLYDQNKFQDALDQFKEVLKKHPNDEQAKNNLEITRRAAVRSYLKAGSQDFLQGDYIAAMEKWRTSLQLENDNKVIKDLVDTAQAQLKLQAIEWAGKGDLAYQGGKIEEAVGDWGQALDRDPANTEAKSGMEKVRPEAKKLEEIYLKDFKELVDEDDLPKAGEMAKRIASIDKEKGQEVLKDWSAKTEARAGQLSQEADQAAQRGAMLEVVEKLEAALQLKKDDPALGLRLNQAKVNLRTELTRAMASAKEAEAAKNLTKALKEYRRVLELEPVNSEAQMAAKKLEKIAKAKKSFDPAAMDELYYQGVYAYAAGDTTKAMGFWKKVLEADPEHRLANEAVNRANKRLKALSNVN